MRFVRVSTVVCTTIGLAIMIPDRDMPWARKDKESQANAFETSLPNRGSLMSNGFSPRLRTAIRDAISIA